MTEQVRKRRSLVIYALGITNSTGQSNKVAARKPSLVFQTLKKNAHSAALNSPSYGFRKLDEIREEFPRNGALEEMFVASHNRFVAVAHSILRDREDAEDAVQEAFLSAHRHWRSFEGRSALRTWLTRIVLNAALMIHRKRKRRLFTIHPLPENSNSREVNWTENIPASEPDPEMIHAERETLQLIDGIVGKLKPALRQALTMTYFDELSGSEASAMLGVSTGTFKARLFRAKRQVLARTGRALVAPIHKKNRSSEFVKCK
jgi:RNA polymerase sigma-70 factor, ECF subfamily